MGDIDWYFTSAAGAQQGPVDKAGLAAAFQTVPGLIEQLSPAPALPPPRPNVAPPTPPIPAKPIPAQPTTAAPTIAKKPAVATPAASPAVPAAPAPTPAKTAAVPAAPAGPVSIQAALAGGVPKLRPVPTKAAAAPAKAPVKASASPGDLQASLAAALANRRPTTTSAPAPPKKEEKKEPTPAPKVELKSVPAKQPIIPPKGATPAKTAAPVKAAPKAEPVKAAAAPVPVKVDQGPDEGWTELTTPEGVPYFHNKISNVTTWDKPDCLKTSAELDKAGEWVWMPQEGPAFLPARKVETYYDGRVELELEDGRTFTVAKNTPLEPLQWSSLRRLVRDLVMLDEMNQPLILHNLSERFKKNEIYTNVGTILISVNPYVRLPLYTPTIIDEYRHRGNKQLAPHVFTISDDAYNNLIENNRSQSIVISGESGAGKTECTKQCLQYLAEVAGSSTNVEQKILLANPILEAFGNAKTVRNNNSSRFGKYVEIFFDARGQICGAKTTNYLLEKSRVVGQSGDERNYHIFYQLCAGFGDNERKKYRVGDALSYTYLNQSGNVKIDDVDDVVEYKDMCAAMDNLNFDEKERAHIFQVTSAVLHLGNITFRSAGEKKCEIETKDVLADAAALLEVKEAALQKGITYRTMVLKGQDPIDISLGVGEATAARDALAKFTYAKLFDWLVKRINTAIGAGVAYKNRSIGILDIFGFEIFQSNSFEQLCINFANEKLQQYFNQHTFKKEEAVYRQEKIQFDHVAYIDNQPVLDLIEKKPNGIMPSLDEELKLPKGSDQGFVSKLHLKCKPLKEYATILSAPESFLVRHYAGDVTYDSKDWLIKNQDRLLPDLYTLLTTSTCPLLQVLFKKKKADAGAPSGASGGKLKRTLGMKFQQQLNDLMNTLNNTEPHYIRCVKPNKDKAPMQFVGSMVLQQLQYSGVFEAVKIRKSGFPFRYTHEEFMKRFKCLLPKKSWKDHKVACLELIAEMKQDLKEVQVGVSRVLYRAGQHRAMELTRNVAVEKTVIYLQSHVRRWLARRLRKKLAAVKPSLTAAIASKNLERVEKSLDEASGLPFPLFEWEAAKVLKKLLSDDRRITQQLESLVKQDPEKVFDELSKGCAAAADLDVECEPFWARHYRTERPKTPVSLQANKLLNEVQDRRKTRKWLQEGVEEADEKKLDWALAKAKELKLDAPAPIKAAEEMKARIIKEKQLMVQLTKYTSEGGFMKEGDTINVDHLTNVVNEAKVFQMKTQEGLKLERLAKFLVDMRGALQHALGTKDKALWKAVEVVVVAAGQEFGENAEISVAREQVSHQAAVEEICERLHKASLELDQEQLTYGLKQADALKIDEVKYEVVPVAREYLSRIVECRKLIVEAKEPLNEASLVYAIEYADSFGYDTEEIKATRVLRDQVLQINAETPVALRFLEEDPMKDVLARADALNLKTDEIERIRTLIHNTSEEKFVQLQLKAALATKDPARAIRVTIRLKDLFFKKAGPMFMFDNFPKLRPRAGWAAMKLITLKRDALAAGMREHAKSPIHASLTELDSKLGKQACSMFKNIMGFMGDRAYESPMLLAEEVLKHALATPQLRDEIYCQLVKQLTKNPGLESTTKGWQLMALCLETFPPAEFENYLEWFLRQNARPTEKYVKMLHSCVYGGPRLTALSQSEIQQVIGGATLRAASFEEKKAYVVPQAVIPAKGAARPPALPTTATGVVSAGGAAAPALPSSAPPSVPGGESDPAAEDAPPESVWQVAVADSGQEYYYNVETGEVTWDKPADLV